MSEPESCLIYARVSTADQEYENQLIQLRKLAADKGWTIVREITEVASGGKADRIGISSILTLAHQRKFDVLLFWSLDRLSREGAYKTIQYLTELDGHGIGFYSYTEPYLNSLGVFKEAIIALLSCLAKQQRIRLSERTKAGLQRTVRVNHTRLGRPRTSEKRVQEALRLRGQGLSYAKIGEAMGISAARVCQIILPRRDADQYEG